MERDQKNRRTPEKGNQASNIRPCIKAQTNSKIRSQKKRKMNNIMVTKKERTKHNQKQK